jgi:hypothetical protein
MPCFEHLVVVLEVQGQPLDMASNPAASFANSGCPQSAPRTIRARRSSACPVSHIRDEGVETAQLAMVAEFDARHVIRRGAGFAGDAHHIAGRDVEKLRASSIKRATSQGQAIRSIFGRSRVIHFMMFLLSLVDQPAFDD